MGRALCSPLLAATGREKVDTGDEVNDNSLNIFVFPFIFHYSHAKAFSGLRVATIPTLVEAKVCLRYIEREREKVWVN